MSKFVTNASYFIKPENKVPTVDQETGVMGNEPSETLAKFRSGEILFSGKKARGKIAMVQISRLVVFFGQNLICEESLNPRGRTGQVIRVGDSVHVLKKLCSSAEAAA
eukprot:Gb_08142 [translate_table: standard]